VAFAGTLALCGRSPRYRECGPGRSRLHLLTGAGNGFAGLARFGKALDVNPTAGVSRDDCLPDCHRHTDIRHSRRTRTGLQPRAGRWPSRLRSPKGTRPKIGGRALDQMIRLIKATSRPSSERLLDRSWQSKPQSVAHRAVTAVEAWHQRVSPASVTKSQCRPNPLCESEGSRTCGARRQYCSHMDSSLWCSG
jgi:hypothetical protein